MQAYGNYIASKIMMWFHNFYTNYIGTNQAQCKITIKGSNSFTDRHAWSTKQYWILVLFATDIYLEKVAAIIKVVRVYTM